MKKNWAKLSLSTVAGAALFLAAPAISSAQAEHPRIAELKADRARQVMEYARQAESDPEWQAAGSAFVRPLDASPGAPASQPSGGTASQGWRSPSWSAPQASALSFRVGPPTRTLLSPALRGCAVPPSSDWRERAQSQSSASFARLSAASPAPPAAWPVPQPVDVDVLAWLGAFFGDEFGEPAPGGDWREAPADGPADDSASDPADDGEL